MLIIKQIFEYQVRQESYFFQEWKRTNEKWE